MNDNIILILLISGIIGGITYYTIKKPSSSITVETIEPIKTFPVKPNIIYTKETVTPEPTIEQSPLKNTKLSHGYLIPIGVSLGLLSTIGYHEIKRYKNEYEFEEKRKIYGIY